MAERFDWDKPFAVSIEQPRDYTVGDHPFGAAVPPLDQGWNDLGFDTDETDLIREEVLGALSDDDSILRVLQDGPTDVYAIAAQLKVMPEEAHRVAAALFKSNLITISCGNPPSSRFEEVYEIRDTAA
jgi:hypothetical protein